MMRAWYLGLGPDEVAARSVLIGDPGRIELFAEHLSEARVVSEQRGLRTLTGSFAGVPITVTAFGMGAPIAAIVLEELAALGTRVVLRAGTAMSLTPQLPLGSYLVAYAALRGEGTSLTYAPAGYPAAADPSLVARLDEELAHRGLPHREGVIASCNGFYSELFAASAERTDHVAAQLAGLRRLGILAADMETSAVLVVGALLGVRAGSVCLISVDGLRRTKLSESEREAGERQLVQVALRAISRLPDQAHVARTRTPGRRRP